MREKLYRGKRKDNGEWVEGLPSYGIDGTVSEIEIFHKWGDCEVVEVIPKTVGQYTGLKDKNGKKIFEGDLLRFPAKSEWEKTNYEVYEVFWHNNDCCDNHIGWQMNRIHFCGAICGKDIGFTNFKPKYTSRMEVIGNIFDNPELLKDGENE
jgi:uncharacterized phage protein (TIGR01671 family)